MNPRILLVMPEARRDRMMSFLSDHAIDVFLAEGVGEAQAKLAEPLKYDLAFVDAELPDGSWRDLLQFVVASRTNCEMVVCSRVGDERLWAEVIQCGAFDLLPEPMEKQEILRIMHSALDSHYMEFFGHHPVARAC